MEKDTSFNIRPSTPADTRLILKFILELAEYEKMTDQVIATADILKEWLFEKRTAEVVIAELDSVPVGYMLFFQNFSTFLGRGGIYLEDLYIQPHARGKGFGKQLLKYLAAEAVKRGCGRMEWACLDWNRPSIDFYLSLGAQPMDEWTTYRLSGDALRQLAN